MKSLAGLLIVPCLAIAGQISGTVSDLSGNPVPGAKVSSTSMSDVSNSAGAWFLERSTAVAARAGNTIRVSSNLALRGGRLWLALGGRTPDGKVVAGSLAHARFPEAAGRESSVAAVAETLTVFWKGKRLVQLPLSTDDTSGVDIQVDTAWSDDYGIPWNPRVSYGSLRDERDGHVYRTITVGKVRWMAENLNHGGSGLCVGRNDDSCRKYGRHGAAQCPQGWRLPTSADFKGLLDFAGGQEQVAGETLRSRTGWNAGANGSDQLGFRALPAGLFLRSAPCLTVIVPDGQPICTVKMEGFGKLAQFEMMPEPGVNTASRRYSAALFRPDELRPGFWYGYQSASEDLFSQRCVELAQ